MSLTVQQTQSQTPLGHRAATPDPMTARHELEGRARAGARSTYVGDGTVLCRVLDRYPFYVDGTDRGLAPHLILDGYWEPWITVALQRLVQPGMMCLDVGANVGYFTVLLADLVGPGGAVVAFEPNPRCADLLRANVYANGALDRTVVSEAAAGSRDGETLQLRVDRHYPQSGSVLPGAGSDADHTVHTVTLDTVTRDLRRVDVIKIDVEGAEEQVWDGMQGLLDRNPQIAVILEFNAERGEAGRLLDKILARFPHLRHIDFDGSVQEVTADRVMTERGSEDWMLLLRR